MDKKCAGVKTSGYWKGYPCHAAPVAEHDGKPYCANHYTTAKHDPGRFEKARKAALKREAERHSHS